MSQFYASFEDMLVLKAKERLLNVVENLSVGFMFVPNVLPTENYMGLNGPAKKFDGAIALTTHRLMTSWKETIASWKENYQCVRTLHIPALNNVSERPIRSDKPNWPYQAILMLPGGLVLIAQTQQPNKEHARQLSSLLNEAMVRLGALRDDTGSLAAIIAYEEEKERQRNNQDDDYNKKKEK